METVGEDTKKIEEWHELTCRALQKTWHADHGAFDVYTSGQGKGLEPEPAPGSCLSSVEPRRTNRLK